MIHPEPKPLTVQPEHTVVYPFAGRIVIRHEYDERAWHRLVISDSVHTIEGRWAAYTRIAEVTDSDKCVYEGLTDYFGERVALVVKIQPTK